MALQSSLTETNIGIPLNDTYPRITLMRCSKDQTLLQDLERIKGDFSQNYQTIAVKYGAHFTKILFTILVVLTLNPIYFLLKYPEIGGMKYYFFATIIILITFLVLLWFSKSKRNYVVLHLMLKLLILAGVFSLALIDYSVIIDRILLK